jgi:hypothetical protein
METIVLLLVAGASLAFLASFLVGMGHARSRSESEDTAQYRACNPTAFIHHVSENDSVVELIKIMCERHLPYLVLMYDNGRTVVTIEDLMRARRQGCSCARHLTKRIPIRS